MAYYIPIVTGLYILIRCQSAVTKLQLERHISCKIARDAVLSYVDFLENLYNYYPQKKNALFVGGILFLFYRELLYLFIYLFIYDQVMPLALHL